MREVLLLSAADARRMPWKNGCGVTTELLVVPDRATLERGDFDLRISKANVNEPGPFSSFPGFDRVLVVIDGDALMLSHGERVARARLRRWQPYSFSGDWPTSAQLPAGPIADFSVLARRGRFSVDVQVLALGRRRARESVGGDHAFVHVTAGEALVRISREEQPLTLRADDSVWIRDAHSDDEIEMSGSEDATVLLIVRVVGAALAS